MDRPVTEHLLTSNVVELSAYAGSRMSRSQVVGGSCASSPVPQERSVTDLASDIFSKYDQGEFSDLFQLAPTPSETYAGLLGRLTRMARRDAAEVITKLPSARRASSTTNTLIAALFCAHMLPFGIGSFSQSSSAKCSEWTAAAGESNVWGSVNIAEDATWGAWNHSSTAEKAKLDCTAPPAATTGAPIRVDTNVAIWTLADTEGTPFNLVDTYAQEAAR